VQGILEYLMTLANSNFEDWRREYPELPLADFQFSLDKVGVAGSLFDATKLQWVNNGYLSRISTEELFQQTLEWATTYAPAFASLLQSDEAYAKAAMHIERHTEKDPKRFTLYSDVQQQMLFFFDNEWEKGAEIRKALLAENEHFGALQDFVRTYSEVVNLETDEVLVWFDQLKQLGKQYGYAATNAEFKEGGYIGKVGDLAMFLRIQLCNAKQTPDLFSVMKVMGKKRVVERLRAFSS
jgi:glutamyl-tRNA synthetase